MKRLAALVVAVMAGVAGAATPLEDATYEATKFCLMVDAPSIEACGNSSVRSASHSAARKALIRMYNERTTFMQKCEERESLRDCQHMAEWNMLNGTNRAGDEYWKAKGFK